MRAFQRQSAIAFWVKSFVTVQLAGSGCGQLVGNPHPPKDTGDRHSSLHIALTDAPIDDAKHLCVSFSRFALWHGTNAAWVDLNLSVEERVDVLALREGITIPFGFHAEIPVGKYERMLVQLDPAKPATLVYKNGEKIDLAMIGDGTGVTEHDIVLEIGAGETLNYTLDFDVRKSVLPKDAVDLALVPALSEDPVLAPHYRLVSDDEAGAIEGTGEPGDVICLYEIDHEKDTDKLCLGSVNSGVASAEGKYKVPFLPAGSYAVRIFKPTGDYVDADDETVEVSTKEKIVKEEIATTVSFKGYRKPDVSHESYKTSWEGGAKQRHPVPTGPDALPWWSIAKETGNEPPGPKSHGKKAKTSDHWMKNPVAREQDKKNIKAQLKKKGHQKAPPGLQRQDD